MKNAIDPNTKYPIVLPSGELWPHTVFLKNVIEQENIIIGDYSYYTDYYMQGDDWRQVLAPYLYPVSPERLIIGKFCQLAHGTQFMAGGNHQMDGFSTFPFAIFGGDWAEAYSPRFPSKGDTVVGNDVWIGHGSLVMPGVKIGDGCIVASRTVVTRDVPPYSIVAGNPGKVIRQRFDDKTVQALLDLAWWDWPLEKITENIQAIVNADLEALPVN